MKGLITKENIIVLLLGILAALFFFKQCETRFWDSICEHCYEQDTIQTVVDHQTWCCDTITYYDTISGGGSVVISEPTYDPVEETNTYINDYQDSTLSATITSVVSGSLLSQDFSYLVTREMEKLIQYDTIKETTTIRLLPKKQHVISGGLEIGGNGNYFQYSPMLMYTPPNNKFNVIARYEINGTYQNSVHVGVVIPLFKFDSK